jgi:hypothetical protein
MTCLKISNSYKVKRTYPQFLELEEHIVELIDKYDTLRKKNSMFPLLSGKTNFSNMKALLPSSKKGQISTHGDTNSLFLQRIEDLEKFLKSVVYH